MRGHKDTTVLDSAASSDEYNEKTFGKALKSKADSLCNG